MWVPFEWGGFGSGPERLVFLFFPLWVWFYIFSMEERERV